MRRDAMLRSMKKERRNDDQFCLRLSQPMRDYLAADARAYERSVSWVMRKIISEHYQARAPLAIEQPKDAAHGQANGQENLRAAG